jgi:hypothetical protein
MSVAIEKRSFGSEVVAGSGQLLTTRGDQVCRHENKKMRTSRCPHCRQRLGNYLYATHCPFCHEEIAHNQKQSESSGNRSSHTSIPVATVGIAIVCVVLQSMGVPLPGLGEPSTPGGHALRVLGAGFVGAAIGFILSSVVAWHAKGQSGRRVAFLSSFAALPGGRG